MIRAGWTKICSKISLIENRNFVRALLLQVLLVVEIKRSGRGSDGFRVMNTFHDFRALTARRNQNALVSIACLRMLITFLLKTKTRIRPVHAHHLCQCPFFSILSSTLAEWDENQNKRALPPPKAAKHSLKYIPEGPLSKTRKQEFNIHSQGK